MWLTYLRLTRLYQPGPKRAQITVFVAVFVILTVSQSESHIQICLANGYVSRLFRYRNIGLKMVISSRQQTHAEVSSKVNVQNSLC